MHRARRSLKVVAIKAPGFGERKSSYLEDIATLTGGQVVKDEVGLQVDKVRPFVSPASLVRRRRCRQQQHQYCHPRPRPCPHHHHHHHHHHRHHDCPHHHHHHPGTGDPDLARRTSQAPPVRGAVLACNLSICAAEWSREVCTCFASYACVSTAWGLVTCVGRHNHQLHGSSWPSGLHAACHRLARRVLGYAALAAVSYRWCTIGSVKLLVHHAAVTPKPNFCSTHRLPQARPGCSTSHAAHAGPSH